MARSQTNTVALSDKAREGLRKQGIYLLADGRWMAKIPNGRHPDTGAQMFLHPKSADLKTLLARIATTRGKQAKGEAVGGRDKRPITTGEWALQYLERVTRPKCSVDTYNNYRWVIDSFIVNAPKGVPPIGVIPFCRLDADRIEKYVEALREAGTGAPSINYMLSRLRAMFNEALRRRLPDVGFNAAAIVAKEPEEPQTPWVGDPSETRLLIETAGEDYRASIIQVATDAGLRRSEIAGLQWGDIDWDNHSITLRRHVVAGGKGAERLTRIVPGTKESKGLPEGPLYLSDRSMAMLRDTRSRLTFLGKSWKAGTVTAALYVKTPQSRTGTAYVIPANPVAEDAFVWPSVALVRQAEAARNNCDGAVYEPTSLGKWFTGLVATAGLPPQAGATKTLHDLRHDCATFLINSNRVPPTVVAHVMRHADASITLKRYSHLYPKQAKDGRDVFNGLWAEAWADEEAQAQAV
jgi:integrase